MQALVTLNDEQFVEAARHFAKRILKSNGKDFNSRLDYAFELATARPADDLRRTVLKEAHDKQLAIFQKEPDRATKLLSVGESKRDETIDARSHAAWTIVASMILNLDETLNRE